MVLTCCCDPQFRAFVMMLFIVGLLGFGMVKSAKKMLNPKQDEPIAFLWGICALMCGYFLTVAGILLWVLGEKIVKGEL